MIRKMLLSFTLILLLFFVSACGESTSSNPDSNSNETQSNETNQDSGEAKPTAPDRFLVIGSGPMGSGWYPITTILSEVYMDGFENLNVSQLEGGSTANLRGLEIDDIKLGINFTSDFADALIGDMDFETPLEQLSGMASLYPVYQTIATLQSNTNINTIEDIVSTHIFLGPRGGGGPVAFWRMMAEYGIDEDVITEAGGQISYGNYSDGASMLRDGNVDVFVGGGAPAVAGLLEIEMTRPIKVIPIDKDKLDSISNRGYGISSDVLPAGTYRDLDVDILTYTTVAMFTLRKDLDEEYVYNLTKLFWENIDAFASQLPERASHFTLETAFDGIDIETLHPGAKKYYREVGALND